MRGLEAFIAENWPFGFCPRQPPLLTTVAPAFSGIDLDAYLKVILDLDWADICVPGKL